MEGTEFVFVDEIVVVKTEFAIGGVIRVVHVGVGVYAFINVFTELCEDCFRSGVRMFMCRCRCNCAFVFRKRVHMCMRKQRMIWLLMMMMMLFTIEIRFGFTCAVCRVDNAFGICFCIRKENFIITMHDI